MQPRGTVPDVVIPGFMKAGSTSLHRWLEAHPAVATGSAKEPNFLTSPKAWAKGIDWYSSMLGQGHGITIDGSVGYLDPAVSRQMAERLAQLNPSARLLIVFRDPFDRAISHIKHDIRRGRLPQRTPEALAELLRPGSTYFERSRYGSAIEPVLDFVGIEQIAVIGAAADDREKWAVACSHVGLDETAYPTLDRANETSSLPVYTPTMRILVDRLRLNRLPSRAPAWLRDSARRVLLRDETLSVDRDLVVAGMEPDAIRLLKSETRAFLELTAPCARTSDVVAHPSGTPE